MTSKVTYIGDLRTVCKHVASGDSFVTDAPVDNQGLGQAFSPTDTVATALASCMFTIMGIKARGLEVDLNGSEAKVTKIMASDPRRIAKIKLTMHLPSPVSEKNRTILERAALTCPVNLSLHPDIERDISFHWDL